MKSFLTVLIFFGFLSCERGINPKVDDVFEVTVAGEGVDCGLILIDFQEKDKDRIEKITGRTGWLRYFAFNLDEEFNQEGQVLIVTVRKTRDDELYACTTQGPGYPWVTILKA